MGHATRYVRDAAEYVRHGAGYVRDGAGYVRHTPRNVRHGAGYVRHTPKYVRDGAGCVRHTPRDVRHGARYVRHAPEYVRHTPQSKADPPVTEAFVRPFDLSHAPLLRVTVRFIEKNRCLLLLDMPHIVSDGTSTAVLIREFSTIYDGGALEPLRLQYKDYSVWQRETTVISDLPGQKEHYWLERFRSGVPVLELPLDFPRPSRRDFEGDHLTFDAGETLTQHLNRLASRSDATLFMVLLAAYTILLHRHTSQEDIVTGCGAANRRHHDVRNMVGMFVNILPIRHSPSLKKTVEQLLEEVKTASIRAFEHQDYPFDALVEKLNMQRDPSRNPVFDAFFILQNMAVDETGTGTLKLIPHDVEFKTAKFDLSLDARETNGIIRFDLEYRTR
ncbi:MAG: hypothetical protein GY940_37555, partial [bacterium]|nr:hypothetical protein [bacterium]